MYCWKSVQLFSGVAKYQGAVSVGIRKWIPPEETMTLDEAVST